MSFDFKLDPLKNFLELYKEAQIKGVPDANAMALATVNKENQPSVRIVFYKGMINGGFSFYTNYDGRKAQDIEKNNKVAANFFWPHLDQQIRIEGIVTKLSRIESEAYFLTRPRLSQLGAWTSDQSEKMDSFEIFKQKFEIIDQKYKGAPVPCPPHWGGYTINPSEIEFWFGKSGRLHERYVYKKTSDAWEKFLRFP
ncbi:MAG: pyridoxamine 5'-phosphate oxidase [Bdellovibrionota bacterium]